MKQRKLGAVLLSGIIITTLGLSACSGDSATSAGQSGAAGAGAEIPAPDVACDIPAGNLDGSAIDTSTVEGEITFQTQGLQADFGDFFKAKIKEFEDANPGVKINWTDQGGGGEFDQTITAQVTNCKMADVVNVPSSTILALSKANLLMDYDVKAPGIGDKFVPSIWDSTALGANDHHTALPWYYGPYITTYNKAVFKNAGLDENKPPATMEEMFDQAAEVAASGKGDFGIYGSPEWYMVAQLHGMGVNLLNKDRTAFDFASNPVAISYVTRFAELYKSGAVPKDSLTGEPDPGKAYANGNLAFGTPNASFLKSVKANNKGVYDNTGVGPFPTNKDVKPVFEGQYIAVSVTTKNAPLAMEFAEWITNAENELAWTRDGGAIIFPAATEALDKLAANPPAIADDPVFKAAYEQAAAAAKEAEAYPDVFYLTGGVQAALVENVNKAIRGEVEPEKALMTAQEQMNKLLKELNG
ncbi:extracellular solute-binding protein [Schaalia sp. 19OD2882]|uniref:extracellular solute-binding protein n=1 Tax=Schaalia sp. 19OD2882 TaxID=2794089 RepID=UPI001C1EE06D|nr:extracellular solute-binding protein [Schaalia sp. 19OD2882]QWW19227.1 extracellular solute-binding protein [Schaalia sp. 19OD2882]